MSIELFNLDFFRNITYLFNFKSFLPNFYKKNIFSLLDVLDDSTKGIILDVDQTVLPFGSSELSSEIDKFLQVLRSRYKCCFLSNFPSTNSKIKRLENLKNQTGIEIIYCDKKKPDPLPFYSAIKFMGFKPSEIIMVGDRILTDIIGANNVGLKTILIKPLDPKTDPFLMVKVPRFIELILYTIINFLLRGTSK